MLIVPPPKFRKGQKLPEQLGLQLVGATYAPGSSLTLVFNKAINIAGIVVSDFFVNDPLVEGCQYTGRGTPNLFGAVAVRMQLQYVQDLEAGGTTLTVNSGNGIVSSDGSQRFAGVSDLVIALVSE